QLGYATADARMPTAAVVLRDGESAPRTVEIGGDTDLASGHDRDPLPADRAHYGEEDGIVVTVRDVRDDLGGPLPLPLGGAREQPEQRPLAGVVLDLRGNGGGSTDGAIDALALFMPGVPLFPMKRRDGTIETDRAPAPKDDERWTGPIATLVDGATASAAE